MIYLDNGATSFPKPHIVHDAYANCMRYYAANAGRGAHRMSIMAAEKMWETRQAIARLFGIKNPERIVFTHNCTAGINMGLCGTLHSGDDLVITNMEHNSVYRPAMALSKKGIRTLFASADKEGVITPDAVRRELTPRTKMVLMQHASNVGGGINPIREIGAMLRKKGVLFMIDAAQTAGCVPIDVVKDNIDILAFSGHKGLLGPQGTGGLYVRDGLFIEPVFSGGTGSESESPFQPDFLPDRLESGTQNLPGIAGLGGGVRYVMEKGVTNIGAHERMLCAYFADQIKTIEGIRILGPANMERRVGVLSVAMDTPEPVVVAQKMDEAYGIAVRAGLHCAPLAAKTLGVLEGGSIRFSPGPFNTIQDMDYAARAFREIMQKK